MLPATSHKNWASESIKDLNLYVLSLTKYLKPAVSSGDFSSLFCIFVAIASVDI